MRPKYETSSDVSHQSRIIGEVCGRMNLKAVETGFNAAVDAIAFDASGLHSVIEVKRRTNSLKRYPTYSIGAAKIDRLIDMAEALKTRALLVVEFADGLYALEVPKDCDRQEVGGRSDRGDPHDVELMYHYDTSRFTMIRQTQLAGWGA